MKSDIDPIDAVHRLWAHAQRDTHQSAHVAHFLLGLYNGQLFPFDLTRMRGLDGSVLEDCIAVLHHCSAYNRWIDELLGIPSAEFSAVLKEHGLAIKAE